MAKTFLSVSPQQHLSLTIPMTNGCLGQHSLPANPPAHQPNLTGKHTSQYSSFLAPSPNFWLMQGLRWHSAEWKKKKSMCSRWWWKYPAVLLPSWLSSELWLASAPAKHDAAEDTAIPLLAQVQGFTAHSARSRYRKGIQFDEKAAGRALGSWICHSCCHQTAAMG